mmetsp:Transcript_23279/g.54888  ORF Transcript_23279/g.54888 Transcript_23279/m.54888 type:complete len:256 (-) Transcript_23279:690-1457(-)
MYSLFLLAALLTLAQFRWSSNKWEEIFASHVRAKNFGNDNTVLRLVGFQQTANTSSGSAESGVQHVHVGTTSIQVTLGGLLASASRSNTTGLVIRTVRAAHQLTIGLLTGKPRLEIVLFDGCVVQFVTDQANDTVGESEGIVEFLRSFEHALVFGLGNLEIVIYQAKLFNLFELMNTENTSNVLTRRPGFLSEARGDTSVSQRKSRLFDPFVLMIGTQWLFGGSNEVFFLAFTIGIVGFSRNLVELLVKVVQLCD